MKGAFMNMNQYWRETICFICGVFLGAGVMLWLMVEVYEGKPKPQPVVRVETRMHSEMSDQRVKEMRFALEKLERLKGVHDATLREAAVNQGDIRQMVERLGVTR
jgi:hypothetical protein